MKNALILSLADCWEFIPSAAWQPAVARRSMALRPALSERFAFIEDDEARRPYTRKFRPVDGNCLKQDLGGEQTPVPGLCLSARPRETVAFALASVMKAMSGTTVVKQND
jgi:hypothetical protein